MIRILLGILLLFTLISCGENSSNAANASSSETSFGTTPSAGTGGTSTSATGTTTNVGFLDGLTDHMADAFYSMTIYVGGKPFSDVLVDTASSNLILLGDSIVCPDCITDNSFPDYTPSTYSPSSQALYSGQTFDIQYAIGQGKVQLYQDNVALQQNGTAVRYQLGAFASGSQVQNIFGLGYPANMASLDAFTPLPFFDVFAKQTGLNSLFTINLCANNQPGNFITFGAIDSEVQSSAIQYTPIIKDSLSSPAVYDYYNVTATALWIDGQAKPIASFPTQQENYLTVVDSGTSLLILPTNMVDAIASFYQSVAPTNFWDLNTNNPVTITDPNFQSQLKNLQIEFPNGQGGTFKINISPQTYTINLGTAEQPQVISGLQSAPPPSDMPGVVLLGDVFLQNTYAVFDREHQQLGLVANASLCAVTPSITSTSKVRDQRSIPTLRTPLTRQPRRHSRSA